VTGIFKANNPSGNAILFVYAAVLKLPLFLHVHEPVLQASDGILYKGLLRFIDPAAHQFGFIYPALTFLLLFMQAVSFNKIVNDRRLHKQPNYLTGMSYLLVTSLLPDLFNFSAPLIINTFMIWIWGRLCILYNNPNPKATIFNIGLVTGVAVFFYFPSIFFLLLIMAGIAVARPFRLREWITGLVGVITPVYFFGAWLFLTGNSKNFHFPGFHFSYPHFNGSDWMAAGLILIALAVAAGLWFVNINMRRQVVQTRKSWQLLFLYLIVSALIPFINAGAGFSYWILTAVPLSPVIAAAFFYPQKKAFPLLLHWAMFTVYIVLAFVKT
jgi:hypothetical protein